LGAPINARAAASVATRPAEPRRALTRAARLLTIVCRFAMTLPFAVPRKLIGARVPASNHEQKLNARLAPVYRLFAVARTRVKPAGAWKKERGDGKLSVKRPVLEWAGNTTA